MRINTPLPPLCEGCGCVWGCECVYVYMCVCAMEEKRAVFNNYNKKSFDFFVGIQTPKLHLNL